MEITEFEKKRAANLIWNGAQDYTVASGFRVYDSEGRADVYWNSIVGAIHKNYQWKKLMLFYDTFDETINQDIYESLFWIAFENGAYEHEKADRPVFPFLRAEYAKQRVQNIYVVFDEGMNGNRASTILKGHLRHCLGEDSGLPDLVDRKLLDELEIGAELDTDQAIAHLANVFRKYFGYHEPGEKGRRLDDLKFRLSPLIFWKNSRRKADGKMGPVRAMAFGYGEHTKEYGGSVLDQSHLSTSFAAYTAQTDEGMKQYIEDFFGKSMYDLKTLLKVQKDYCTGNHTDVKLHFTKGDYDEESLSRGYAGKMHKQAIEQAKKNREAYDAQIVKHRIAIDKLTARIRNSVMMHLDAQEVRSNNGRLDASRIWRGIELDDDKVFNKTIRGEAGNITVDILLDASTSQVHRQDAVSAQGYMIAQALTNVGIPTRVYSFCSLNGYTVVNMFRDYGETNSNAEIFRYFTTGANRDGLAVRVAAGMLRENSAEHRILIVLSDCKPNDVIKVRSGEGQYKDYAAQTGVADTAAEVHAARMAGITVMCVFTGNDEDLPSVKQIYGSSFARIRSLDMFADTVGNMLQTQIRML